MQRRDALVAMQSGDLDVTVFQDAAGQGAGALDAALKLAKGEAVDQKVISLPAGDPCQHRRLSEKELRHDTTRHWELAHLRRSFHRGA
jgi:hypothetical protein